MKKIITSFVVLAFFLLCGCTQNNGHIGPIFGSWALVGIAQDGVPLRLEEETVFSFQNKIVQVTKLVDPPYTVLIRYGNFTISDDVLTMKFQLTPTPADSYMYIIPDWLYFPHGEDQLHFDVRKLKGSEMILGLETGEKTLIYSFKKTW